MAEDLFADSARKRTLESLKTAINFVAELEARLPGLRRELEICEGELKGGKDG